MSTRTRLVTIETMPEYLKASHRAAGNWGTYPLNGAERTQAPSAEAKKMVAEDPDGYTHIVRKTSKA